MTPEQRTMLIGQIVVEIEEKRQAADRLRGELRSQVAPASSLVEWLKVLKGGIPALLPLSQLEAMAAEEQGLRLAVGKLQNQLIELGVKL